VHFTGVCLLFVVASVALCEAPHSCSENSDDMLAMPKASAPDETAINVSEKVDSTQPPVSKRLFGVIPNYRADEYQVHYTPISTAQKFKIARSDSFDWPNYFLLAGYALQSQVAAGGFTHSGGLNGFGRFYSRSVADQVVGAYTTEAILPSLLHEDPRYFRLGSGPILSRALYAASRIFVTKRDDGTTGFYVSEIIGNMGVTAFGTLYYPDSRTASSALERYGMSIGNDMISNMLTEFWPDIKRKMPLLHRKA
jgi:hypothetical protein